MWLSGKDAGAYIGYSRDTVEIRAIPWQPTHVLHQIRYKLVQLDEKGPKVRRYYQPDLDALLQVPPGGTAGEPVIPINAGCPHYCPFRDPRFRRLLEQWSQVEIAV